MKAEIEIARNEGELDVGEKERLEEENERMRAKISKYERIIYGNKQKKNSYF